jgi:prepilin-type N-terminal cleavage/methylation domain-containing protein
VAIRTKSAFTLVEMLVVIAIIGILVSLLLPGVQMAREAARRAKCTNNFRNLAMAVQQFEDANKKLPPNRYGGCGNANSVYNGEFEDSGSWSWMTMILPYIDQKNIYDQAGGMSIHDQSAPPLIKDKAQLAAWIVPLFFCPSDGISNSQKSFPEQTYYINLSRGNAILVGQTTYKGVAGTYFNYGTNAWNGVYASAPASIPWCHNDGLLFPMDPQKTRNFSAVKDGLSHTFMIGEQHWSMDRATCTLQGVAAYGLGFAWAHAVEATAFGNTPPNWIPPPTVDANGDQVPVPPCSWEEFNGFRSRHVGGVLFARCDGSSTFMTNTTDLRAYRAMCTINGYTLTPSSRIDHQIEARPDSP